MAPYTLLFLSLLTSTVQNETGRGGQLCKYLAQYYLLAFMLFLAIRSSTKGKISTGQSGNLLGGNLYPLQLAGIQGEEREPGVCRGEREDPTVTNDYEHLLISLAFIIVEGKLGLVCTPTGFGSGIVEEEADREPSVSVGG